MCMRAVLSFMFLTTCNYWYTRRHIFRYRILNDCKYLPTILRQSSDTNLNCHVALTGVTVAVLQSQISDQSNHNETTILESTSTVLPNTECHRDTFPLVLSHTHRPVCRAIRYHHWTKSRRVTDADKCQRKSTFRSNS